MHEPQIELFEGTDVPNKTCTLEIFAHERFQLPDGIYRVMTELSGAVLLMKKETTGREIYLSEQQLVKMLGKGEAVRKREVRDRKGRPNTSICDDELAPDEINTPRGHRATALWTYVRAYDGDAYATKGKKGLTKLINEVRPKLLARGITYDVTPGRLLWAINNCGSSGNRRLRYFLSQRGKIKRSRLPAKVEEFLAMAVSFYWDKRGRDHNDAAAYFRTLLATENAKRERTGRKQIRAPKRNETLRRRTNLAANHANWARKYGKHNADQKFRGVSDSLNATAPGELVIVDHTLLDALLLIDRKSGLPLGRPWLSLANDVATGAIVGFLVTPEPPSLHTFVELLKRINRDKSFLAEKYPHVEGHTDSWCLPTTVLVDNDWTHLSPSAQDMFADLGMEVIYAPAGTPQYKPRGERPFHTFNTMVVHKMAGGIPDNIVDRRLSRHSHNGPITMTIEDLEGIIYETAIVYENEPREGVGGIPAQLWQEGIQREGRHFIDDISSLDVIAAATNTVQVTKGGVRYRNMRFHDQPGTSQLLNDLVRFEPKRTQSDKPFRSGRVTAKIKYNPADCSQIHVWNPSSKQYVTLWNRDSRYCEGGLSFWSAQQIFEFAKEKGLAFRTDAQRAFARNRLREHWEAFIPGKTVATSRDARRGLAQEKASLNGSTIVHTSASPSYSGNEIGPDIATDLAHQTRHDGDLPPAGVRKNAIKAEATRKRNRKRREDQAKREQVTLEDEKQRAQKPMFVPGTGNAFTPRSASGWGPIGRSRDAV